MIKDAQSKSEVFDRIFGKYYPSLRDTMIRAASTGGQLDMDENDLTEVGKFISSFQRALQAARVKGVFYPKDLNPKTKQEFLDKLTTQYGLDRIVLKDPYPLLGLNRGASLKDVKKAY